MPVGGDGSSPPSIKTNFRSSLIKVTVPTRTGGDGRTAGFSFFFFFELTAQPGRASRIEPASKTEIRGETRIRRTVGEARGKREFAVEGSSKPGSPKAR